MTEQKKSLAQLFAACWKDKVLTAHLAHSRFRADHSPKRRCRDASPCALSLRRCACSNVTSGWTKRALQTEEHAEREIDQRYWSPLRKELEKLRHARSPIRIQPRHLFVSAKSGEGHNVPVAFIIKFTSWMLGDCDKRNDSLRRTVTPKQSIRAWSAILNICLKKTFVGRIRTFNGVVRMCL